MAMLRITASLALLCLPLCSTAQPNPAAPEHAMTDLRSPDPLVREAAARALGHLDLTDPSAATAVEALIHLFSDSSAYVQGAAAVALGSIGEPALQALSAALADTSNSVRWCATIALGRMGMKARMAIPLLTTALADRDENVRWCATAALCGFGAGAQSAVPALRRCLLDGDPDVRWGAALALAGIDHDDWLRPPSWDGVLAAIDTVVPHLMKELHVPGVSLALIRDGRVDTCRVFGTADVRTGIAVTDSTLFEAASMSKPVFACAVMALVDSGLLDLDRPIAGYFAQGDLPHQPERNAISARMILSHTSGFPNWRKGEEEREGPLPVMFTPGSKFGYSGEGIFFLQRAVEHLTGEKLEDVYRRMIAGPAGLPSSTFIWSQRIDHRLAAGHDERGGFLTKSTYLHPNAAYTFYTTAREYAAFLTAAVRPGTILSASSIDAMLSHRVPVTIREPIERPGSARGKEVWWGLGWSLNATGDGDIVHHSGANRTGFRCFSQYSLERRTGLVIMTNGLRGSELWERLIAFIGNL